MQVQIMSGINIPVRSESIQAIENFNRILKSDVPQAQNLGHQPPQNFGGNSQYPGGDSYGRSGFPQNDPYGRPPGNDGAYLGDQYNRGPRTENIGYNRPLDNTGRELGRNGRDGRFGGTNIHGPEGSAPPYNGYGNVTNPYGTNRGQFGNSQYTPQDLIRNQQNVGGMGALQKAQLELTGLNKLIQGSVFIEVRLVSNRRTSDPPQIKRTRE